MTIEADLLKIAEMQAQFKADHGTFFEMDWAAQKIDPPNIGDKLNLRKIKRFVRPDPIGSMFPAQEITDINFVPTAKDWRFCIGRGIKRDRTGVVVAECWYAQAAQKAENGLPVYKYVSGGDEGLLKADGMLEYKVDGK